MVVKKGVVGVVQARRHAWTDWTGHIGSWERSGQWQNGQSWDLGLDLNSKMENLGYALDKKPWDALGNGIMDYLTSRSGQRQMDNLGYALDNGKLDSLGTRSEKLDRPAQTTPE